MDFLLCCPRGPDHQGRHAVPEAESAADGPPWAAGAEKDRKRKKIRPRGCTGSAAKPQRVEKCDLRRQVREEMVRSAIRLRHDGKASITSINVARAMQRCRANRGEEERNGNRQQK